MQDHLMPMISVRELVKPRINSPTRSCLMKSLNKMCDEYF